MSTKMETTIRCWLRSLKIPVSPSFLRNKLRSHPNYPSLASITGTLDDLGIDNAALAVDNKTFEEVPVPFLAHSPVNGGEFIEVKNIKRQACQPTEFEKNWSGIVILAEKPKKWHHVENGNQLIKERKSKCRIILSSAAIIILAGLSLFNHFSWQAVGLFLFTLVGLAAAILIIQHELGISNEVTEQLCSAGKQIDCNAVMHSKGSQLSKWLNWADIGIIYFSSFFCCSYQLLPY